MSDLDQIVSLTIKTNSASVSRLGFGICAFVTYHTYWTDTWRKYSDLAEAIADGVAEGHPLYNMLSSYFDQDPRPPFAIVARKGASPGYVWEITVTSSTEGDVVSLTIVKADGSEEDISYTIGAAETTTTVATALELLVEAASGITSTSAAAVVSVQHNSVPRQQIYLRNPVNCLVKETTADDNYSTVLSALLLENNEWFTFSICSQSQDNINDAAAWALSNDKLFLADVSATDELTGAGTVGHDLKAAANPAVAVTFNAKGNDTHSSGLAAILGASDPGSITAAYKTIAGDTAAVLTSTQVGRLETDNINYIVTKRDVNIFMPGKVASGEWIDVVHGIAALKAAIQEDQFDLLVNAPKIDYDDDGIELVANTLRGTLKRFERSKFLVRGSSQVFTPTRAEVESSIRKTRVLPNVKFSAEIAGAIHMINIQGTLTQ